MNQTADIEVIDDKDDLNIYYNPEAFGLRIVGTVDFADGPYEFDYTMVWRDQEGKLLRADDSGCSCPDPFEDHKLEDLIPTTLKDLQEHLEARYEAKAEYLSAPTRERVVCDIADLMCRLAQERMAA